MHNKQFPEKVLPYKTYNKIGHLSKSRLGEGDHFIDEKTESQLTKQLTDPVAVIYVEEKLDGSNVCVVRWKGELRCLTRSGYDCEKSTQEQHRMFARWVHHRRDLFGILLSEEEDRVVGEWLALAHGTKYQIDSGYNVFIAFDLYKKEHEMRYFDRIKSFASVGLAMPRLLHVGGACTTNRAIKLLEEPSCHKPEDAEGVIYRMERPGKIALKAKLVKKNKVDGKYLIDGQEIWNWHDGLKYEPKKSD